MKGLDCFENASGSGFCDCGKGCMDGVMVRNKSDSPLYQTDDGRSSMRNEKINGFTASVGREMNVLLEVGGLKKIKKLSSCRRGGSVAMDVESTRDYEFRGVGI